MNRRVFSLALSSVCVLTGCKSDRPDAAATLLNNSGVRDAINSVDSAINDLESNVGDFDSENWREVVPNVESAASDVRDAFENLKRELGLS